MTEHRSELQYEVPVEITSNSSTNYRFQADIALGIFNRDVRIADQQTNIETSSVMVDSLIEYAKAGRIDPKTGLSNFFVFEKDLEKLAKQTVRGDFRLGLMYVDIDGLKRINDDTERGGDHRGDDLIRTVARTLSSSVRGADKVYRRESGDEFGVLFQFIKDEVPEEILIQTRFRFKGLLDDTIKEAGFPEDLYLGASVGFGIYNYEKETTEEFYRRVKLDEAIEKKAHRAALALHGIKFKEVDPRLLEK